MKPNQENVLEQLSKIVHPEYEKNIVELGMIGNIKITDNEISFQLLTKKQKDPFATSIKKQCEKILMSNFSDTNVKIFELYRNISQKKEPHYKTQTEFSLHKVKQIIAISSGKGGVGKSTIAVNLAVALAERGYKTGLVDADIYGPSVPKMMALENARPITTKTEGFELIEPAEKYGVKVLSIGFFVNTKDALIWRAPMATSALKQLVGQTNWGELDFLLIDLPPGTGDIHLTMIQDLKLQGAIVVTTPQPIALADAVKGINMFRQEKINIRIIGLVENMAWFTPEELPENKYYIFGKDGGKKLAEEMEIPLLAQIPIVQSIREGGDNGEPAVLSNKIKSDSFEILADNFIKQINLDKF